jgi:hypothetical protein
MILFWGNEKFSDPGEEGEDQDSYFLDHTVILCIQSFATVLACINSPNYYLKMVLKGPFRRAFGKSYLAFSCLGS